MKKVLQGKKILCTMLMAVIFAANLVVGVSAISPRKVGEWAQFRGDSNYPGITDSKTPRTSEEIEEKWAKKIGGSGWSSVSDPVIVGDYVYVIANKSVIKLFKETGEVALEGTDVLKEKIGFFSRMAYGDGKLFIPIGNGRVQCVDANTLESLWISPEQTDKSLQAIAPVVYYDGYIYMGTSNSNAAAGLFYSLPAEDKDTSRGDEIQDYAWTYAPQEGSKGYYWSGGAIVGNTIVFGGEKGELVSHSLKDDTIIDTFEINEAIRTSIHYEKELERIYVSTKAGTIHSIKVNSDGTFNESSHIQKNIGNDITSSPVTYNGRLYVAGGGVLSSAGFSVLDANTLEVIYQIQGIESQSSPILTTAYANENNNNKVYMYVIGFGKYSSGGYVNTEIYSIEDFEGNTTPKFEKIAVPSVPQYNSSSAAIDDDGSIYFKNDSSHLFKFANKNNGKFTAEDVINSINNIPELENISLNDEENFKNILDRYNNLSEDEKLKVINYDKLELAMQKIEELKDADKVVETLLVDIEKLPQVIALEHRELVNRLFANYERLPESHKEKVTNSEKLIKAKNDINILEEKEIINNITKKIEVLPELKYIILDVEESVNNLYEEFTSLTENQQEQVVNREKLEKSKEKIDKTRAEVEAIDKEIWDKLDPKNITLDNKEIVDELIARYNALDERDRSYIKYYEDVLEAKSIIEELEELEENKKPDDENLGNKEPDNEDSGNDNVDDENTDVKNPSSDASNNDNSSNGNTSSVNTDSEKSNGVNNKADNNDSSKTKLPNTGGINNKITLTIAIILIIGGIVLFNNKKDIVRKR